GLCASFIVADGVAKSAGPHLLSGGGAPHRVPLLVRLVFVPPALLFAWVLRRVPPPPRRGVAARRGRPPLHGAQRRAFFRGYAVGLTLLGLVCLLITILRSVRADFAPEIWAGLQKTVPPDIFARSELAVAAGVLVLSGSAVFIQA